MTQEYLDQLVETGHIVSGKVFTDSEGRKFAIIVPCVPVERIEASLIFDTTNIDSFILDTVSKS